ncbi:MAG: hypothetical protein ACE5J7_04430, partial [Candidatus Aenigmatarchaeota archaeon]
KKYNALGYFKDMDVAYDNVLKIVKEFTEEKIEVSDSPISYENDKLTINVIDGEPEPEPEEKALEIPKETEKTITYISNSLSETSEKTLSEEKAMEVLDKIEEERSRREEDPESLDIEEYIPKPPEKPIPKEKILEVLDKAEETGIQEEDTEKSAIVYLPGPPKETTSKEKTLEILEEVTEERKKKEPEKKEKPKKVTPSYGRTDERKMYCLFWSRETSFEVTGGERCRGMGCDVYTIMMVGQNRGRYRPEDFPVVCGHSTHDQGKTLLEAKKYREEKKKRDFMLDQDSIFK